MRLGTGKPGEGVIVWNKKVVLFNARIEKDNILYEKYSTNFHEKAQRKQNVIPARSTVPCEKRKRDEIRGRTGTLGGTGAPAGGV